MFSGAKKSVSLANTHKPVFAGDISLKGSAEEVDSCPP